MNTTKYMSLLLLLPLYLCAMESGDQNNSNVQKLINENSNSTLILKEKILRKRLDTCRETWKVLDKARFLYENPNEGKRTRERNKYWQYFLETAEQLSDVLEAQKVKSSLENMDN